MAVSQLLTTPCTILRATAIADDYDETPGAPTQVATTCELQQITSVEAEEAAIQETTWRVFLPAGTQLVGADALLISGASYDLLGDPWPVTNPRRQTVSHVEATVRRSQ